VTKTPQKKIRYHSCGHVEFVSSSWLNMPLSEHSLSSKYQILCTISFRNSVVGISWDSRWRPCWIFDNLTHASPKAADFPSLYQIKWCKKFDRRPNYGPKTKFKMAAAAILNLFLKATYNIRPTLHNRPQPLYKVSCQYLNPRVNYNYF